MSASSFVHESNPARILFGTGTLGQLADELDRMGLSRVAVLCTPQQVEQAQAAQAAAGGRAALIYPHAVMHTPVTVSEDAVTALRAADIDGVVAIGGGSTTGLGKAIALRTDWPQISIPTTYAGSEVTPIIGETDDGRKVTQRTHRVLPEVVIYDVALTTNLSVAQSVTSGLNAIAHAAEALYAAQHSPVIDLIAREGIAAFLRALPAIIAKTDDHAARRDALYGAWLCGTCLGSVGMSLHHKLCHVLGGTFDLPHAETHSVILPHALAYNLPAAPEARAQLDALLGGDAASTLHRLAGEWGAPTALRDLGMPRDGIDAAADRAVANPYWNPRPIERAEIRELIARAWEGALPA